MPNITHLENARSLQFSSLSFRVNAPIQGRSTRTIPAFCVTKGAGLAFDIPASQFGLPINALLHFRGTVVDADNIDWALDEAIDAWSGIVHVTHARGKFRTRVTGVEPRMSPACDGSQQIARVQMEIVSGSIVVDTSLGNAKIDQMSPGPVLAAEVMSALHFETTTNASRWNSDACGARSQIQGDTVVFQTIVTNLQLASALTRISYEWLVPAGVTVTGPTNESRIALRFDQTGTMTVRCNVLVETSLGTSSRSSAETFAVVSREETELRSFLCRWRAMTSTVLRPPTMIQGAGEGGDTRCIRAVDPLWAPAPDAVMARAASSLARPFTSAELARLEETLSKLSAELATVGAYVKSLRARAEKVEQDEAPSHQSGEEVA